MATKTKSVKKPATKKAVKKTAVKKSATTKKAATKKPVTKKAATKKAATKKPVTKKAATKKAASAKGTRLPAGYKITKVIRELNLPDEIGGKDMYELYEVTGKTIKTPRYFISDEAARTFVFKTDKAVSEVKAVMGKGHAPVGMRDVVKGTADLMAANDLVGLAEGTKSDRKSAKVMYSDSE